MNWDTKINSILTATDSNVATIKSSCCSSAPCWGGSRTPRSGERQVARPPQLPCDRRLDRLNPVRNIPKEPLFDKLNVNRISFDDSLERPWNSCATCDDRTQHTMSSEDMLAITHQLQCQARTIVSLNQAVKGMEKEREYQKQRMQSLEEEVQRLQRSSRATSEAALERRMEDLRRELTSELRSLREQVLEIPDIGMVPRQSVSSLLEEVNESKRTIWKECESLRREIDQMKQKIRRQEEDMLHQISISHEARRGHDRNSKMLEDLQDSYRSQTLELSRAKSESQQTQLELQYIKTTIASIKDEMRALQANNTVRLPPARKDRRRAEKTQSKKSTESSSEEDDSAQKQSLGDISSDDISSALDSGKGAKLHGFSGLPRTSFELETSIRAELESDLDDDYNSGGDLSNNLEGLSDSAPELNLSDL